MTVRRIATLAIALLAAACGRATDPEPDANSAARLVVYAPAATEARLQPALSAYREATGADVDARYVDGLPDLVIDAVDDPPADLLVLAGAGDAVRAVDEGALRPLAKDVAIEVVPQRLSDPDGGWLAIGWEPAVIAYDVRQFEADDVDAYIRLADPAFAGRLCIASTSAPVSLSVVAALIGELGVRPAERVVRGWLANLSLPVFESPADLPDAVADGRCGAAIVPGSQRHEVRGTTSVVRFETPAAPAGVVLAAGVARHASHPEEALRLLEWLATEAPLAGAVREVDARDQPAADTAATGWLYEEARKLAERAGYR